MFRKLLIGASTLSLVAAPVTAQAADRQASPVSNDEHLAGIGTMGLLIGALLAVGLIIIIADNNNHHPKSP